MTCQVNLQYWRAQKACLHLYFLVFSPIGESTVAAYIFQKAVINPDSISITVYDKLCSPSLVPQYIYPKLRLSDK